VADRDSWFVHFCVKVVAADEAVANEAAAAAQAIKDDCENDLAEAIPALDAAISALNTLKPADITEVRAMKVPGLRIFLPLLPCVVSRESQSSCGEEDLAD